MISCLLGSAYADERVSRIIKCNFSSVGRPSEPFFSPSLHIVLSSQWNFNETRKTNAMETTHALVFMFVFLYKMSELWLSSHRQPIKEKTKEK